MLVDTENLVSTDEFRRDFEKFVKAAKKGNGPVAVMKNDKVIGFFVSAEHYRFCESELNELIESRLSEPTVSHEEVKKRIAKRFKRRAKA